MLAWLRGNQNIRSPRRNAAGRFRTYRLGQPSTLYRASWSTLIASGCPRFRRIASYPAISAALPPAAVMSVLIDFFLGKAVQIMRAARFRAGARQAATAERLRSDDRADLVAINVDVADLRARRDMRGDTVDARVDAERQTVARRVDRIDELVEFAALPRRHMKHRSENLALQIGDMIEPDRDRGARNGRPQACFVRPASAITRPAARASAT